MKKIIALCLCLSYACLGWGCHKEDPTSEAVSEEKMKEESSLVVVTDHGIDGNGALIGGQLNRLVNNSFGKTLYFPPGTYNLSEPIVLPLDYTKNVNLLFDKNATLKSDIHLEALIKVGYSETTITDSGNRRFSYIEGGILDCYNADNGILVNGRKQMLSIRTLSLVRGRRTHIRIHIPEGVGEGGTGSSDTKLDNVTIQGISSNDDVYGIYIDRDCHDCKISDTFIYGTKEAIVTRSAGHILNNVHILSVCTTGGTYLEEGKNYRSTVGIRILAGGFFVFNQIYYDTVERGIVVDQGYSPELMLDQQISYSYLKNFGTSFIHAEGDNTGLKVKLSNSTFTLLNDGFKLLDVPTGVVGWDVSDKFSFVNSTVVNAQRLYPYELALLQKLRYVSADGLLWTSDTTFDTQWYVLGAVIASPMRNNLEVSLTDDLTVKLEFIFKGDAPIWKVCEKQGTGADGIEIGYAVHDGFCVLLFRSKSGGDYYPTVYDRLGSGKYMPTPYKQKYTPQDYYLEDSDIRPLP